MKTKAIKELIECTKPSAVVSDEPIQETGMKAESELAAIEAENARLAEENLSLRTNDVRLLTAIAVKDTIIKSAIDTMKTVPEDILGRMPDTPTQQGWWFRDEFIDRLSKALSSDPAGKALVAMPEIMLLRDTIRELLDVQNGCPLPKYTEAFDAANAQATEIEEWLGDILKANGC